MPAQWDASTADVFLAAKAVAQRLKHPWLGTEHVALGMLETPSSLLTRKLRILGREPEELEKRLHKALEGATTRPAAGGDLALSPRLRHIVAMADALAAQDGCTAIDERHLLQALLDGGPGVFIRTLLAWGVEPGLLDRARQQPAPAALKETAVAEAPAPKKTPANLRPVALPISHNPALVDMGVVRAPGAASRTPLLDRLGTPIASPTPAVERPELMEDLVVALCRGPALLVGPSGCGKTALLGMLAVRAQIGQVPPELQGMRVVQVPAEELIGTHFDALLAELKESPILLVLDELHRPLSQHAAAGYAALKRALDAPSAHVVATTTPEGHRTCVAPEATLKRRLRTVDVPSTLPGETRAILDSRRAALSQRFGVEITDDAVDAAVRPPHPEAMPAHALDLLEEACIRARGARRTQVDEALVKSLFDRRPS